MKDIVICAQLNEECLAHLKQLKAHELIENHKIHIIHCFEIQVYTADFSPFIYPSPEQYPELISSATGVLENFATELGISKDNLNIKVLFSKTPKESIIEYIKEVKADLSIVATRGLHGIEGLFASSFAEYLIKHSPSDVYIIRPE